MALNMYSFGDKVSKKLKKSKKTKDALSLKACEAKGNCPSPPSGKTTTGSGGKIKLQYWRNRYSPSTPRLGEEEKELVRDEKGGVKHERYTPSLMEEIKAKLKHSRMRKKQY